MSKTHTYIMVDSPAVRAWMERSTNQLPLRATRGDDAMSKSMRYWLWIEGKPGTAPHQLHEEIAKHDGFMLGRSCGTWATAQSWLRDYMRAGFIVRVYEVAE